jgi:alpha-beta hydrolase superfamily lysophospholipase
MNGLFTVENFTGSDSTVLRYGKIVHENPSASARPIVFVPGLGGSVKHAISFLTHFTQTHGPVYSLDARGFGLNETVAPHPNPGDYLKDLTRFVAYLTETGSLQANQQPIIIGLSLGAVLTTVYLTGNIHPFKSCVLVSGAFRPHPKIFPLPFRLKSYAQVALKWTRAMTTLPYGVRELTRNPDRYDDPNFQDVLTLPSLYLFLVDRLCARAFSKCRELALPTAIVVPEGDMVCDPAAMKLAYERLTHPQKTLLTYPDLYHDVMLEPDPDQRKLFEDLDNWLISLYQTPETQATVISSHS